MTATFPKQMLSDYYARAEAQIGSSPYLDYVRTHGIRTMSIGYFAGVCTVLPIVDYGLGRFDFAGSNSDSVVSFVCEALDRDGETVIDLVAWPLDRPDHVMSLLGRAGLLGICEAMSPATYFMGGFLYLHRTPFHWLQSGCRGAVVVTPHFAGRMLLDIPGKIAAADIALGKDIDRLIRSAVDLNKVLVPTRSAA